MSDPVMCCTSECGSPATLLPIVYMYGKDRRGTIPTELKMPLCAACAGRAVLADFDSADLRQVVARTVAAFSSWPLDFSLNKLGWKPIKDSFFRQRKEI